MERFGQCSPKRGNMEERFKILMKVMDKQAVMNGTGIGKHKEIVHILSYSTLNVQNCSLHTSVVPSSQQKYSLSKGFKIKSYEKPILNSQEGLLYQVIVNDVYGCFRIFRLILFSLSCAHNLLFILMKAISVNPGCTIGHISLSCKWNEITCIQAFSAKGFLEVNTYIGGGGGGEMVFKFYYRVPIVPTKYWSSVVISIQLVNYRREF